MLWKCSTQYASKFWKFSSVPSGSDTVKRLPAMWETWVLSLGREDPLEKEMATYSSIHAWKIRWIEEPGGLQSMGSQRVGHDWATSLLLLLLLSILWHCLSLRLVWKLTCGYCWVFQICWHIECSTFTASSFRIWNSSTGIPSLPLALFVVMIPKAQLNSHSRMSGSRWVITPLWLSESWRSFLYSSFVYSCHLFLISSAVLTVKYTLKF